MCRSIRPLRSLEGIAGDDEVREAALQFIRKVSGIRQPSPRTQEPFDLAVERVADTVAQLLDVLPPSRAVAFARPSRRASGP